MQRNLKFERLYNLGNYSNVLIGDEVIGLPEGTILKEEFVEKVYYLMMINSEIMYRKYKQLYNKAHTFSEEQLAEAIAMLESEKVNTLDEIKSIIGDK